MSHSSSDSSEQAIQNVRARLRGAVPVEDASVVAKRRSSLRSMIENEIADIPRLQKKERRRAATLRFSAAAAVLLATVGGGLSFYSSTNVASISNHSDISIIKNPTHAPSETEVERHAQAAQRVALREEPVPSPQSAIAANHQLEVGESVMTEKGVERTFTLPGETRVRVGGLSQLHLLSAGLEDQRMMLTQGSVHISVPHEQITANGRRNQPKRSVRVLTPHAQVEVKGTIFLVEVIGQDTHVLVERGVVLVHHTAGTTSLTAGEQWNSSARRLSKLHLPTLHLPTLRLPNSESGGPKLGEVALAKPKVQAQAHSTPKALSSKRSTKVRSLEPPSVSPRTSTLAQQNALLEGALTAANQGDHARALRLTEQLIQNYPSSPLRASARAVRRKLLKQQARK